MLVDACPPSYEVDQARFRRWRLKNIRDWACAAEGKIAEATCTFTEVGTAGRCSIRLTRNAAERASLNWLLTYKVDDEGRPLIPPQAIGAQCGR